MQNLVMVSTVVIVAFVVIFTITYTRVQNENREKLLRGPVPQSVLSGGFPMQHDATYVDSGIHSTRISGVATRISPDAGLSFSLTVDSMNNLVEIDSMVDLPEYIYEQAANFVMYSSDKETTIMLENRTWQYAITSTIRAFRDLSSQADNASWGAVEYKTIRFLDVTDSIRMIRSLIVMLSGLIVVIMAIFFFISRFFANRAIRPMEETWEKQNRFITDASHELKTPLSIIQANCGVLYSSGEETLASQARWIDSISRAADRINGLVSSLLNLARMEEAQFELQKLQFDLSAVAICAVSEIEAAVHVKGLSISKEIEPDIEIESDKEQVRQILSILLDNATKYTDSGGDIKVSLKKEKRNIVFSVRNSGGVIPPGDLARLFDRFYRGDPARSSGNGGYGLGLSIAKTAAEKLNARLTADSKPNMYTEFCLSFSAKTQLGAVK